MDNSSNDGNLYKILKPLLSKNDYMPYTIEQKNTQIIAYTLTQLNNFYNTNYRNSYYIAFQLIQSILKEDEGNSEVVGIILDDLKQYTEQNEAKYENKDKIYKLIDYLYLELARYSQFNATLNIVLEKSTTLEHQYGNFQNETNNLRDDINDAKSKTDDIIGKSVSILGVFTGIVMAFSGAFSILSGAFDSLSSSISKYRVFGLFSLIGFIIYNVTVILLFVISRISGKDIGVKCKQLNTYECGCDGCTVFNNKENTMRNILCQVINKYPHILIGELLFVYIMYFVFCTWLLNPKNRDMFPAFLEIINKCQIVHDIVLLLFLIAPIAALIIGAKIIFKPNN